MSSLGQKLWANASKALSTSYDGTREKLTNFIADVHTHVYSCRLNDIMRIVIGLDGQGNPTTLDLLTQPALISLHHVIASRDARQNAAMTNYNARQRINSEILFNCLNASITGAIKTHVAMKIADNTIQHDGPTLFKIILTHTSGLANMAAVRNAKAKLRTIQLASFNGNVRQMHASINTQLLILASNQTKPEDMMHILLTAYKKTVNPEFQQFACRISDAYDDGTPFDVPELMAKAESKYDALVAELTWNTNDVNNRRNGKPKDNQAAQILALQAKLDHFTKNKTKSPATGKKPKINGKISENIKKYQPWKLIPPKGDEPKSKFETVKTKDGSEQSLEHHWCIVHNDGKGLWCQHKPEDCKLAANIKAKRGSADGATANPSPTKKPRLVANFATIQDCVSGFSDSDDDDVLVNTEYHDT
jgi:hypothetical protein